MLPQPVLAVQDVFAREYAGLCRLAALLVGSRALAEEVVMDVFERVLRSRPDLADSAHPEAYLRQAVVNGARNALRRRGTEGRALVRLTGLARHTAPAADSAADAHPVLLAVRSLPARQRAAVVLRYYADLPEAEIAEVLGCSAGTVKSQLAKARARLAAVLAEEGDR